MPAPAQNILQQVQTYQLSSLGYLQNLCCFISNANTKFKDFEKLVGNLGDAVSFDLPPRLITNNSLVVSAQPAIQRTQSLICSNPKSTFLSFSSAQFVYQVEEYMHRWGKSAVYEIGTQVESDVAQVCLQNTFRFFGDGTTPITSYTQLAQALAMFRNFGSATGRAKGFISDIAEPQIIGTGLNQFALDRNNKDANSWELGSFSNCDWFKSNLLPIHYAGTEGTKGSTLTVVATNATGSLTWYNSNGTSSTIPKTSDGSVTAIQFNGCNSASDNNSIAQYDRLQFKDGVSGYTDLRYLTFIGHKVSNSPVQFSAAQGSASNGSNVVVLVGPQSNAFSLQANSCSYQNLNTPIVAGMQCSVMPSHKSGLIYAGDPLFLAMPKLPDQPPYYTGNEIDPDTGVSIRMYFGTMFGADMMGIVHDCIYGYTLVPEMSMALVLPLTQ
jgi:hypothetical protein